jgi:hypothetical protein
VSTENDIPTDDAVASVMRSALTHSAAARSTTPTEWARVYARGRRRVIVRRVAAATALVVVVAGAAGVATAAAHKDRTGISVTDSSSTSSTSTTPPESEAEARRRAATNLANKLLGEVVLPSDAQLSTGTPPAVLGGLIEGPLTDNHVGAHHIWTSAGTPNSVAAFARAHAPAGFTTNGGGSESAHGAKPLVVVQPRTALPANVYSAELHWAITDATDGGSVFRIDAVVGWFPPVAPATPRPPAVRVTVASGCPATITGYRDVNNPVGARGPLLLPSGTPTGAVICTYAAALVGDGALTQSRALDAADATSLADALNRVAIVPDIGAHGCTNDTGSVSILAFSYAGRPDADVWWHASGCQSLDNGYVVTAAIANPSFYNDFIATIHNLIR